MNLNALWAGNDYALFESKGRNEHYRENARRVRIIRTFQVRDYDSERGRGMAEVTFLHDNGDPVMMYSGDERRGNVRARDIAMRWEEYEDERIHRKERQEQRLREARELQEKESAMRVKIMDYLETKYGVPRLWITVGEYTIGLSRNDVERAMNGETT